MSETRDTGRTCFACGHRIQEQDGPGCYRGCCDGPEEVRHNCIIELRKRIERLENLLEDNDG